MLCIQGKERSVCQKHEGKVLGGGLSLKDRRKKLTGYQKKLSMPGRGAYGETSGAGKGKALH